MWLCLCTPRHIHCLVIAHAHIAIHTSIRACFLHSFCNPYIYVPSIHLYTVCTKEAQQADFKSLVYRTHHVHGSSARLLSSSLPTQSFRVQDVLLNVLKHKWVVGGLTQLYESVHLISRVTLQEGNGD